MPKITIRHPFLFTRTGWGRPHFEIDLFLDKQPEIPRSRKYLEYSRRIAYTFLNLPHIKYRAFSFI